MAAAERAIVGGREHRPGRAGQGRPGRAAPAPACKAAGRRGWGGDLPALTPRRPGHSNSVRPSLGGGGLQVSVLGELCPLLRRGGGWGRGGVSLPRPPLPPSCPLWFGGGPRLPDKHYTTLRRHGGAPTPHCVPGLKGAKGVFFSRQTCKKKTCTPHPLACLILRDRSLPTEARPPPLYITCCVKSSPTSSSSHSSSHSCVSSPSSSLPVQSGGGVGGGEEKAQTSTAHKVRGEGVHPLEGSAGRPRGEGKGAMRW